MNKTKTRNLLVALLAVLLTAALVLLVPALLTQEAHADFNYSSGGSSGGSGGSSSSITPTIKLKPTVDGSEGMTWEEIAAYIRTKPEGSHVEVLLNDNFDVPDIIQLACKEAGVDATFVVDETRRWFLDASDIETAEAMDLRIALTASIKMNKLRGVAGKQFMLDGTGSENAKLSISFGVDYIGQYANIYRLDGDKLVYVKSAKIGEDGAAELGLTDKGTYLVMLCEYSDLSGDANNDGALTPADASSILKNLVGLADIGNEKMADFNGDGSFTPADASAILKALVA